MIVAVFDTARQTDLSARVASPPSAGARGLEASRAPFKPRHFVQSATAGKGRAAVKSAAFWARAR